jgi:hypothetical protein
MFLFLDSNYGNALAYGGRQIGSVFPEVVQRNAHSSSDRASTVSQISYCLRLQPPGQGVAIVFGGFENFSTGTRSIVQLDQKLSKIWHIFRFLKMFTDITN